MADETAVGLKETPRVVRGRRRERWGKLETFAKVFAGIGIPLVGVLATVILGLQGEANRQAQVEIATRTEREKADSDIRQKMFDFLLTRYFSAQANSAGKLEDFQTRLMVLRLLLENFQEHFSSRSLFTHLYRQITDLEEKQVGSSAKKPWQALKAELIDVGKNTASQQLTSLAPVAFVITDVLVPHVSNSANGDKQPAETGRRIPLYSRKGLSGGEFLVEPSDANRPIGTDSRDSQTPRYSIAIDLLGIREDAATVRVFIYEDAYIDNKFGIAQLPPLTTLTFDASFFSTPYMDNTRLSNEHRFSIIYKGCIDLDEKMACRFPLNHNNQMSALFDVFMFKADFVSRRDSMSYAYDVVAKSRASKGWTRFLP